MQLRSTLQLRGLSSPKLSRRATRHVFAGRRVSNISGSSGVGPSPLGLTPTSRSFVCGPSPAPHCVVRKPSLR